MARIKWPTWIAGVCCNCTCIALLSLWGSVARAQPSEPPKEGPTRARQEESKKSTWLHEIYLQGASEYDFYLDAERRQKLELRREPVMSWTSGGDYYGDVYVWTHQGRAAVVGCMLSGPLGEGARRVSHEFHSLASQPLVAGKSGGYGWHPEEPGIKLEPIPDAPEPAETEARRLVQMRAIARRYHAHMMNRDAKWDLRLLPQPVYRYERTGGGGGGDAAVVDGALFAFVWPVGTDPELLLVIEAVRNKDGEARWHFAPARFTNREVWVTDRDREVWRVAAATAGIFDGVTSKPYGVASVKTVTMPGESQ